MIVRESRGRYIRRPSRRFIPYRHIGVSSDLCAESENRLYLGLENEQAHFTLLSVCTIFVEKPTVMFIVIAVMAAGITAGYLLRKARWTQYLGKPVIYTVALLLFLMGVSVGSNKTLTVNLLSLGADAALIAVACTMGSVLAGAVVYRVFFKKEKGQ